MKEYIIPIIIIIWAFYSDFNFRDKEDKIKYLESELEKIKKKI